MDEPGYASGEMVGKIIKEGAESVNGLNYIV